MLLTQKTEEIANCKSLARVFMRKLLESLSVGAKHREECIYLRRFLTSGREVKTRVILNSG